MAAITIYPNQLYHQSPKPLDSSSQVDTVSDLNNNTKVVPYAGKMVHVKDEGKVYICSSASPSGDQITGTWQPLFNDSGTEFYLKVTSDDTEDTRMATLRIKPDINDPTTLRLDIDWD